MEGNQSVSVKMDEPSNSSGIGGKGVNEVFFEISKNLQPNQCQLFGMALGLELNDLLKIQRDADVHNIGSEASVMQILEKWRQKVNPSEEQMVPILIKALKAIDRNDIADKITNGGNLKRDSLPKGILKEMQKRQRQHFGNLLLPRSLWLQKKWLKLDELFVELTMKKKNEKGEELDEIIYQREIFNELDEIIPRRILVEGHPGYGKTTLVAKLLSDWSKELNKSLETGRYISDKFDLVFVVPLRNYEGNLEQYLIDHCEEIKGSPDDALNVIEKMQDKVLLLLDGLDEINTSFIDSLNPLLDKKKYCEMTVIVTCRTGHIPKIMNSNKNLNVMGLTGFEEHSVWDKRIQIKGISSEKRLEFLKKYFNVEVEEIEANLSKLNLDLNDFYECPLFLQLLGVLIEEGKVEFIGTRTEMYKMITNFVINRSLDKKTSIKDQDEIDLFDFRNTTYRNLFIHFGELCVKKIIDQTLTFKESELEYSSEHKNIFKEFFSKEISFFHSKEEKHYQPIHLSFLEFFAAFYLSTLDEDKFHHESIKFVTVGSTNHRHVLLFLGGLYRL